MLDLINGDCLQTLASLPDACVDCVIADLPFGTTNCSWDVVIPFEPLWRELYRVARHNAAFVMFSAQPFTTDLIQSNRKDFRYDLIWQKNKGTGFLNARRMPMREHEIITIFYRRLPTYNPQRKPRSDAGRQMVETNVKTKRPGGEVYDTVLPPKDNSTYDPLTRGPSSVVDHKVERGLHPTQKPVSLLRYLIRTYSDPGDVILDPTMGSGSTGVAALAEDRKFIGIERDPKHFATAVQRCEAK